MSHCTIQSWVPRITGPFLVLDTETTGLVPGTNKIITLGAYLGGEKLDETLAADLLLQTPYTPESWSACYLRDDFRQAMSRAGRPVTADIRAEIDAHAGSCARAPSVPPGVAFATKTNGKRKFMVAVDAHGIMPERSVNEGLPREEGAKILHSLLKDAYDGGLWVIGHNLLNFDLRMMKCELDAFGLPMPLRRDRILDTGAVVKASQLNASPGAGQPLLDFQQKIMDYPSRVKWALDSYCVGEYGLEKYGVDTAKQHSAGYDCFVTACLVREIAPDVF